MNFYYVALIFNLFIIVVAILGWVRFPKISPTFFPFLIFIWLGTTNEIFSAIVVNIYRGHNIVNYNIYILFEPLLILWQFKQWGLFIKQKKAFQFLFFILICFWITETIVHSRLSHDFNYFYQVFYSAIIVVLSISMLNQVLMTERRSILKNPIFIICCVLIISFTYTLTTQCFAVYRVQLGASLLSKLHRIFIFINLFCNIIYALAIWWMPKRQAFALQY